MRARSIAAVLGTTAIIQILAIAASATPADGPYLRLEAGGMFPTGVSVTNPNGPNFRLSPSDGPIGGAALGMRLTPFRIEVDVDWMRGSIKGGTPALSGSVRNIPAMANVYLDIANPTRLEPYIGFGLGVTSLTIKASAAGGTRVIDSSAHPFALQPIVGVNLALTDRITVGLQYRYFKSVEAWLATTAGQRFGVSNGSHNVLATLTYHFFAPERLSAAAPAAIPAPAMGLALPAQTPAPLIRPAPHLFLVFFDFDRSTLTAAGRRSADEVIVSYRQDPTSAIEVRGFTDLVGTEAYNLELSKRRALTVYEYFAAHGVKPGDMGIDWEGKANPRVPTTKREPQNRRVEIEM